MFARFFDTQDTVKSYDDNYREFISSVFMKSDFLKITLPFQLGQLNSSKFPRLIMFSSSVKWVKYMETLI